MNMTDEELIAKIDENFAGWHYEKPGDLYGSEGHLLDLLHQCRQRIAGDGWVSIASGELPELAEPVALINVNEYENTGSEVEVRHVQDCGYLADLGGKYWAIRGERGKILDSYTHWKPLHGPEGV